MKPFLLVPLSMLAGFLFAGAVAAQEMAKLPYAVVYQQLVIFETLGHLDKIKWSMGIRSRSDDVEPSEIEVSITEGGETLYFPLGPEGEADFPLRKDWSEDGELMIETNQPSGTLNLDISFEVKPLPEGSIDYAWLADLRDQLQEAMNAQAAGGAAQPSLRGLKFLYPMEESASITIRSLTGEQLFEPDVEGFILFPMDDTHLAENPRVVFEPLPASVLPLLEE